MITERLGAIARVRQRDVGVCNQFAMEYLAVHVEPDLTFLDGLEVQIQKKTFKQTTLLLLDLQRRLKYLPYPSS